ncbi:interleukin-6 receptor subunit beta-like [Rhineura floridana]|uniref:interleukin-6 receptor subunit beta-like n=1 Tax=Rhineura floridana TaxID=261503 RepID=UPI002AC80DE8|nr:interleukin-6 receptor subunit beta-like [Rhineura floridana]
MCEYDGAVMRWRDLQDAADYGVDPCSPRPRLLRGEAGRCRRDFGNRESCVAKRGDHSCAVPVENLFAFYKITLTAENQKIQANSSEKCIHGMSVMKLNAPEVSVAVANKSRCFHLEWSLPGDEVLSATEAQYEIQFRDMAEESWTQVNVTMQNATALADICGVSPFTNYSVRVRAKYLLGAAFQSDGGPFWSDWSSPRFVRTLPAVPSTGPALWRKLGLRDADGNRAVVLMWKPLKPKEANGEILGYSLHSQREGEPAIPRCLTRELQCTLFLPAGEEFTFLAAASNVVGVSPPTKLVVPPSDGQEAPPSQLPVLVCPAGDHSLLLQWSLPSFPKMGYVFEWGQLPENQGDDLHWHYQPGNVDHVIITEAIEPGKLYGLKIFALIDGSIWVWGSTSAYSKQIAPFRAPTLYPVRIWKSQVELKWDSLPLAERGGVIRNYTICYKEEGKDGQTVVLDSAVRRYLIEGLAPSSIVAVTITVANDGGSLSGPVLSIRTRNSDYGEAEVLFSIFCVGFLLLLLAGSLEFSSPRAEKWRQDFLGLTINNLLRVLPSQQEEPGKKTFLGNRWLVEVPGTLQKVIPVTRNGAVSFGSGGQPMSTENEMDYSTVVVVQKNCGPSDPQSSPYRSQSLSKYQDLAMSDTGFTFGQGVWLQNLAYEAPLDVGSCNRAFESRGEFSLLVSLVTVRGVLHPADSPHGRRGKKT